MGTFLAGLRSRRWLNIGVFALGTLAMLVAVATPLYARSSAEHLLDQRTEQRPVYETGLNIETLPQYAVGRSTVDPSGVVVVGQEAGPSRCRRSRRPTGSRCSPRSPTWPPPTPATRFWKPPTTYIYSLGDYHSGPRTYQIKAYWRDGMCDLAHVDGRCPSAPGEALIDPLMLKTIQGQVGDQIQVVYTGYAGSGKPVKEFTVDYTIVGTYTIDDHAVPRVVQPRAHVR